MKKVNHSELAIKNAALKLFSKKGFHATSTRDICVEGCNKSTRKPEKNVNPYSIEMVCKNNGSAGYMRGNLINNQGA